MYLEQQDVKSHRAGNFCFLSFFKSQRQRFHKSVSFVINH